MTVSIPKWVMIRYSVLYKEFKCKPFTREQARRKLDKSKIKNDEKLTNVFFSELREKGWVETNKDKKDTRKKVYKLINPEKAILDLEIKEQDEK